MKLLVVVGQWFPDFAGGSGRVASETARGLAARGHEVTVIAPRQEGSPVVTREERLTIQRVLPHSFLPKTLTDMTGAWRAARKVRWESFDLVLAHNVTGAVGAIAAATGAPLVVVYHASAVRELRFARASLRVRPRRLVTYPLEQVLLAAEHLAVARAERILVLSEFSRSLIEEDHPGCADRVLAVRGGVDIVRFSPLEDARERLGIPRTARLIVTARRLEPRMGLDELLRALVHLPGVELALIGSGSLERLLIALAETLGVYERTRFLGRVTDEGLRTWYAAADVVAMPTAAYEGFGLVTIEALACGTPVVATPVGASPELLRPLDPGLVAADATGEALAAAIEEALSADRAELGARCREYVVDRYAWDRVLPGWESALATATRSESRVAATARLGD